VIYERRRLLPVAAETLASRTGAITRECTTIRFSVIGMQTFKPITRRRVHARRKRYAATLTVA